MGTSNCVMSIAQHTPYFYTDPANSTNEAKTNHVKTPISTGLMIRHNDFFTNGNGTQLELDQKRYNLIMVPISIIAGCAVKCE